MPSSRGCLERVSRTRKSVSGRLTTSKTSFGRCETRCLVLEQRCGSPDPCGWEGREDKSCKASRPQGVLHDEPEHGAAPSSTSVCLPVTLLLPALEMTIPLGFLSPFAALRDALPLTVELSSLFGATRLMLYDDSDNDGSGNCTEYNGTAGDPRSHQTLVRQMWREYIACAS